MHRCLSFHFLSEHERFIQFRTESLQLQNLPTPSALHTSPPSALSPDMSFLFPGDQRDDVSQPLMPTLFSGEFVFISAYTYLW